MHVVNGRKIEPPEWTHPGVRGNPKETPLVDEDYWYREPTRRNYTMFDWDDTLSSSGSMGSMQVFRKAPTTGRPALSNDWQDVEFDAPGDTNRSFCVKVTW